MQEKSFADFKPTYKQHKNNLLALDIFFQNVVKIVLMGPQMSCMKKVYQTGWLKGSDFCKK